MTFRERAEELVAKMTLDEKIPQMRYDAPAIERLGIPAYNWWNECLHGVGRSGAATVFPQAIGMAASFDSEIGKKIVSGKATLTELSDYALSLGAASLPGSGRQEYLESIVNKILFS